MHPSLALGLVPIPVAFFATAAPLLGSPQVHGLDPAAPPIARHELRRLPGEPRHAGVYHVAAGTWTRTGGTAAARFGPDIIYSNTATSGYFVSVTTSGGLPSGGTHVDEGQIPTQGNPDYPLANRDLYSVNCVSIGYCDLSAPGTGGWDLRFYSSYEPCAALEEPPISHGLTLDGLPANGCWTLDLDLSGGSEFCLAGDGADGYDGSLPKDTFGWSFTYAGSDGTAPAGFLLAGDPISTEPGWVIGSTPSLGTNTYYGPPPACQLPSGLDAATGNGTLDTWMYLDPAGVNSNCVVNQFYQSSNGCGMLNFPYLSFFMEIAADVGVCQGLTFGQVYCLSNPNSAGVNTSIGLTGSPSVAANDVRISARTPADVFGFFLTSRTESFTANPAGSAGNLCLGDVIGRFAGPGQIKNSGPAGIITLDTNLGEWTLDQIPRPSGSYAAAAGITTHFQLWHRDSGPGAARSNFSDGIRATWLP